MKLEDAKEGQKVRRSGWSKEKWIEISNDRYPMLCNKKDFQIHYTTGIDDMRADDWELFESPEDILKFTVTGTTVNTNREKTFSFIYPLPYSFSQDDFPKEIRNATVTIEWKRGDQY